MIIIFLIQFHLSLYGVMMLFIVMFVSFNPTVQLQIKRCLYHRFEHQAEYNLGGSDKSSTPTWNQLSQDTP